MSLTIKKIHIKNFRSIRDQIIDINYLTMLVGNNDSGKSNILRALNLFFNEETNPSQKLDFEEDHSFYNNPNKKAKEISIVIEFELPENYRANNGDVVIWKKIWRSEGLYNGDRDYKCYRIELNRLKNEKLVEVDVSRRSNVHSLLSRVEYRYVPAIKDAKYFDLLRSQIYETIAEVAKTSFKQSSGTFEDAIGEQLSKLTDEIEAALQINTKMAFPRDLSHIFERLDFLGGEQSVSLNNRGDGIKVRHIPLILKFITDKKRTIKKRGKSTPTFIWGYEEPENNLEVANCIQLANNFYDYMLNDTAQILLTTHSPIFYNLVDKNTEDEDYISCHHISMLEPEHGTTVEHECDELDSHMGTMLIMAPKLKGIEEEIRQKEKVIAEAEALIESNKPKIFVEGLSDKLVLDKCVSVFFPNIEGKFNFETKEVSAGVNYVGDMLLAWHGVKKHHPNRPKCAGIVDCDPAGTQIRKHINEKGFSNSIKCFELIKPEKLRALYSKGVQFPVTLEELYPNVIWEKALEQGRLTEREQHSLFTQKQLLELLNTGGKIEDLIDEGCELLFKYKFSSDEKIRVAKKIAARDSEFIEKHFSELAGFLEKVFEYLDLSN